MYNDEKSFEKLLKDGPESGEISGIVECAWGFRLIKIKFLDEYKDAIIAVDLDSEPNMIYAFYDGKEIEYKITPQFGMRWQKFASIINAEHTHSVRR